MQQIGQEVAASAHEADTHDGYGQALRALRVTAPRGVQSVMIDRWD